MFDTQQKNARLNEIATEVKRVANNPTLTAQQKHAFMDKAESEATEIQWAIKNDTRAKQFRMAPGDNGSPAGSFSGGSLGFMVGMKTIASKAAPLDLSEEALRNLHQAVTHKTSFSTKGFSSVDSLLPPQLSPNILGPRYETRLMDRLPVTPISAPVFEYLRHTSTTGAVAPVAEGALKPELVLVMDRVLASVVKLAAHSAVSHESMADFANFTSYVQNELFRQLIDAENRELLNGSGTGGHLTGILTTSGILTHTVASETALDAIEVSIAAMRTGAALASANLLVLHPATWSSIRRSKDSQGRYLVDDDPTQGASSTIWGVDVLPTTTIAAGTGLLLDTTLMGSVLVREAVTLQTGYDTADLTHNLTRFVAEERIGLAVERPAAVCAITGL